MQFSIYEIKITEPKKEDSNNSERHIHIVILLH